MSAKLALAFGIFGTGLQIGLQVYQSRHADMSNTLYEVMLWVSVSAMIYAVFYVTWAVVTWPPVTRWVPIHITLGIHERNLPQKPTVRLADVIWDHSAYRRTDDRRVSQVIMRISASAGSDPMALTIIRFEVEGFDPYYPSEHRRNEVGEDYLVPPGGGWSIVPNQHTWIEFPTYLEAGRAVTGWVGFNPSANVPFLTYGALRSAKRSRLVAELGGGKEIEMSVPIPPPPTRETSYPGEHVADEGVEPQSGGDAPFSAS